MIKNRLIVISGGLTLALLLGCVSTAPPSLEPITPHAIAPERSEGAYVDTVQPPRR